jgi:4-hydroxybenzoate-CoA ligase
VNLVTYIFKVAGEFGRWQETAILFEDRRITYAELYRQVRCCGQVLRELGLGPGERVAIVSTDDPEFIVAFLGCVGIGGVAVPVSTLLGAADLEYILGHAGARVAVVSSDQMEKVAGLKSRLPRLETLLVTGGETEGLGGLAGVVNWSAALAGVDEAELADLGDDVLAFILYTSGSTGRPKGAMHGHRNLPYTVEHCGKGALGIGAEDRVYSSSKLFFAYGLGNSLSFPLATGATTILCKERPVPAVVAGVFARHRPTVFFGVPAVFRALLEHQAEGGALDTTSIRFCVSAGEKLPERIFHEWKARTGLDILDGIGSTEMLQMFITNRSGALRPGSSGRMVPGYAARLLDDTGQEIVGAGTGQLLVQGGSAFAGYWEDPEKTAAAFQGDWVRTGDIYRRDEDGYYWFEGRGDDLFKVKGLWVSPLEVEEALYSHPEVLEVAVVPEPGEDGMNRVAAYVVCRSRPPSTPSGATAGTTTDPSKLGDQLQAHVRARLPPYKCPAVFHFTESLPRTATGKLQRYLLRQGNPGERSG